MPQVATENDALNGVSKDGFIHLINSGATTVDGTGQQRKDGKPSMKPFWEITPQEAGACLDAVSWRYADLVYFRGGGYYAARPKGRAVHPVPIGTRRIAAYSSDFLTEGGIPVCNHNVDPAQVYRPSYWNAFGMDGEGADYRACEALGPLYGKM